MTIIDQSWYKRPPDIPKHHSAGGVIVRLENNQLYVALIQDGDYIHYLLPKGRIENGESHEQASLREIEEEAGLTHLKLLKKLGVRKRLDYKKTAWKKTHYFLFVTNQLTGKPTDSNHLYRLAWFPIRELPSMFWPDQQELLETNLAKIEKLVKENGPV